MSARIHKLAYLVSHPIQYQAPLLRFLAEQPDIDLTVFFLSDVSARAHEDRGFGRSFAWDVPLLDGYRHVFLEPLYRTQRVNFAEPFVRGLERHLRGGFDALWVHGWFHQANLRAMRIARSLGMRVLLRGESIVHGTGIERRVKDAVHRRVLALADGYLAIGARNREFYRHHGIAPERIFDVPYAVDNAFFREGARKASRAREEFRARLGLAPGRPVVLYASKLVERKRPLDLLNAYERLASDDGAKRNHKREPHPYLLFVGDGPERARVEVCAAANGWRSIRFFGFQNQTELPRFYDLCDVLVLPSAYEPWGLVLNEVMNAARPVIATDVVGAAADLVVEGQNGWTVPVGATDALAEKLREVLADDGRRATMGRKSLELVARFDFERDHAGLARALGALAARRAA